MDRSGPPGRDSPARTRSRNRATCRRGDIKSFASIAEERGVDALLLPEDLARPEESEIIVKCNVIVSFRNGFRQRIAQVRVAAGAADHQRAVFDCSIRRCLRVAIRRPVLPALSAVLRYLSATFQAPLTLEFRPILRGVKIGVGEWAQRREYRPETFRSAHPFPARVSGNLLGQVMLFANVVAQIEQLPTMLSVLRRHERCGSVSSHHNAR